MRGPSIAHVARVMLESHSMAQLFELKSIDDTHALAQRIAREIHGGMIIALSGPIGAGKTTFVKALAAALGVRGDVVSPTYTLLQTYSLPRPIDGATQLIHIDAYRLENHDELRAVGVDDFLNDSTCVVVIEWAERVEMLFRGRAVSCIDLALTASGHRHATLR